MAKSQQFPAIEVVQPGATFYVFTCTPAILRKWCYLAHQRERERTGGIQDKGIQRFLDTNRLTELGIFIDGDAASFANNIIINFESDLVAYNPNTKTLVVPDLDNIAWVVDGQYRLFGFERSTKHRDFPLVVTAFLRAPLPQIAYIFRIINSTQRRLNPSLIYDLLLLSEEVEPAEAQPEIVASRLTTTLNDDPESALFHRVNLIGRGKGSVTKAALVKSLRSYLTPPTGMLTAPEFTTETAKYEVIRNYFNATRALWAPGWDEPELSFISMSQGIWALLYAFAYVMRHAYSQRDWSIQAFVKLLEPLHLVFQFPASEARAYSGNPGIRQLRTIVDAAYRTPLQ